MAAAGPAALRPLLFGAPDAPLFGCHHIPRGTAPPAEGVVLCQPAGHEYLVCHRAMRQLAVRLAQSGRAALRFDFTGNGDSSGDAREGLPSRWVTDVHHAVEEMRATVAGMSAVGLRLGAALALMYAQGPGSAELRNLVLWDPVIDGRAYVDEHLALHRERFGGKGSDEVLGFPLTAALRSELEAIDLLKTGRPSARRVLIVETGTLRPEARALEAKLRSLGAAVEYRSFEVPAVWQEQPNQVMVPATVIQAIVTWMKAT